MFLKMLEDLGGEMVADRVREGRGVLGVGGVRFGRSQNWPPKDAPRPGPANVGATRRAVVLLGAVK